MVENVQDFYRLDTEGVVVLQSYGAKDYFTFVPNVSDLRIDNGTLIV